MKKIGVWGWWQQSNLGDNWILDTMFKIFGGNIVPVISNTKKFTGFDFIICGGGGLFSEKVHPPWNDKILTPHGVFCLGTEHGVNEMEIEKLYKSAAFFYVRDKMTYNYFGIHDPDIIVGDVTFYDPVINPKRWALLPAGKKSWANSNITLIWRHDFKSLYKHSKVWKKYIGEFMYSSAWEKELAKRGPVSTLDFLTDRHDPLPYIENASVIVSQRYHGVIAAMQVGIPVIAIDVCPKIRAIMQEADLNDFCIKVTEFEKAPALFDRCKDEQEIILEKMHTFTNKKKILVRKAADNAKRIIGEITCK